jgi:hypothetical protein
MAIGAGVIAFLLHFVAAGGNRNGAPLVSAVLVTFLTKGLAPTVLFLAR